MIATEKPLCPRRVYYIPSTPCHLLLPRVRRFPTIAKHIYHPPPTTPSPPLVKPLGRLKFLPCRSSASSTVVSALRVAEKMDSQSTKQRTKQRTRRDPTTTASTNKTDGSNTSSASRDKKRMAMAKRGLRSLAVAVSVPVSLTLLAICLGGGPANTNAYYATPSKPVWFPPLWVLHFTCIASSFLMGLSAWLVWAEGGFHKKPTAVYLYLVQLGLSLTWAPIVFGSGATRAGFLVCLGMFGALLGCSRVFKEVNPIASDLIKPCLAWTAFLAVVNLKLLAI